MDINSIQEIISTYLPAIFAVVGGGMIGAALYELRQAFASRHWPATTGEITDSRVTVSFDSEASRVYRASVRYHYKVNGSDYQGKRIYFGDKLAVSWRDSVERMVEWYKPGRTVDVYYNLDDPKEAVLERGAHWQTYLGVAAGFLFIGLGLIFYFQRQPIPIG